MKHRRVFLDKEDDMNKFRENACTSGNTYWSADASYVLGVWETQKRRNAERQS